MDSPKLSKAHCNDGPLVQKFEYALNLTIEKFIGYIKFSLFKENYPQIYEKAQPCLEIIHQQLQKHLKSQMKTYAFALYSEQDVPYLLNTFEKLLNWIQKCNDDETVWRQTLSIPRIQTRSKKNQSLSKAEYRDKLKDYLQKLSSENDAIENVMFQNHEELQNLGDHMINLEQAVCMLLDDLKIPLAEELLKKK